MAWLHVEHAHSEQETTRCWTCQMGTGYDILTQWSHQWLFFPAGHRTLYLRDFDVLFRKLIRSVVGPPAGMDWTRPWHEILHDWNGRVNEFAALHGIKLWSERCVQQHWDLAHYISSLDDQRWVKRLMQWQPNGRRRVVGQPTYGTLSSQASADGKAFNIGHWNQEIAKAGWQCCLISFILWTYIYIYRRSFLFSRAGTSRAGHI